MTVKFGALVHPAFLEDLFPYFMFAEMLLFTLLTLTFILFLKTLTSRRVFHPNLNLLLLSQPLFNVISGLLRMAMHALRIFGYLENPLLFQLFSFTTEYLSATALNLIFTIGFERYLASRHLENYVEKYETDQLARIFILGTSVLVFFNIGVMYLQLVPLIVTFSIVYLTQGFAMLFFCWLYKTCRRQFYVVYEMKENTVAARYKTQTNYKASRLLLAIAPFKCFFSTLIVLEYHFLIARSEYTQIVYVFVLFYTIQFQTVSQMWLILFYEGQLRSQLYALFVRNQSRKPRSNMPLKSVHGTKLQYDPAQERDVYFAQLQSMWK